MIRDRLIDAAIKMGVDQHLRDIRASLHPAYRHDREETEHLRKMLRTWLKADSNCIDIGAYRGRILTELMRVALRGRHIAYEPVPYAYQSLVERFPTVDVRMAAVSNVDGETSFTYVKNMPARSGFVERAYTGGKPHHQQVEKLTVRTETLDTNLPFDYVPTLIKIDVEGAERFVIEGGIETITKYKPVIVFEHGKGGAAHYNTEPRQVYELLHDRAGLRIFDMDGNGPYTLAQFEDSYALDERWDYIARP